MVRFTKKPAKFERDPRCKERSAQFNMPLMAAVTGAMWKCATNNLENVERLQDFNVVQILIQVLSLKLKLKVLKVTLGQLLGSFVFKKWKMRIADSEG